jgi:hypothetical protein
MPVILLASDVFEFDEISGDLIQLILSLLVSSIY